MNHNIKPGSKEEFDQLLASGKYTSQKIPVTSGQEIDPELLALIADGNMNVYGPNDGNTFRGVLSAEWGLGDCLMAQGSFVEVQRSGKVFFRSAVRTKADSTDYWHIWISLHNAGGVHLTHFPDGEPWTSPPLTPYPPNSPWRTFNVDYATDGNFLNTLAYAMWHSSA